MEAVLNGLFGGSKPSASPIPSADADFADFAGAPEPASVATVTPATGGFMNAAAVPTGAAVPYTKWYNLHERHTLSDFKQEGVILGVLVVIIIVHLIGTAINRGKAKKWVTAHKDVLRKEFALVGFGDGPKGGDSKLLSNDTLELPEDLLKENSPQEFSTYATGRQNVAFVDVKLVLLKRYSPLTMLFEYGSSLFFDSFPAPEEHMEAILYPFDGKEALTVPGQVPGAQEVRKDSKSAYDGFVWAVVNKETMKQLRDDRYDVSITVTKDSPKLPAWCTVMSESAEITDFMLTTELIKAVESAGELLNHLIITDQPMDQPLKLDDCAPKKRIYLSLRVPSNGDYSSLSPLFEYFLRLADLLVQSAHFRPEVLRKVRATREGTIRKLQLAIEVEKTEERNIEREKAKKLQRDAELQALDAKGQKKYLEKEREREIKKTQKRMTSRQ